MSRTMASPRDGHTNLPSLPIQVDEVAVTSAVLVEPSRDLDVPAAVLLNQVEPPFLVPPEALQPVGALGETEGRLGEVSEAQPESENSMDLLEHVESRDPGEFRLAVRAEDLVVEPLHVEPDHEVGGKEVDGETIDVFLKVGPVLAARCVEDDREGETHVA